MFGRKRRQARREAEAREAEAREAEEAHGHHGGAHLRQPDAPPEPAEALRSGSDPDRNVDEPEAAPPAAPLRSLLTDGERLGFEPQLEIPED